MSAWLCGNGTLSLVVDVIKSDGFNEYDTEGYSNKSNEELIGILSDLNTKSLNCRYGQSEDNILQNRKYLSIDVGEGQRHKSVTCYLYQTCECIDIVEHPLFKALDKWRMDAWENDDGSIVHGDYYWDIDLYLDKIGVC